MGQGRAGLWAACPAHCVVQRHNGKKGSAPWPPCVMRCDACASWLWHLFAPCIRTTTTYLQLSEAAAATGPAAGTSSRTPSRTRRSCCWPSRRTASRRRLLLQQLQLALTSCLKQGHCCVCGLRTKQAAAWRLGDDGVQAWGNQARCLLLLLPALQFFFIVRCIAWWHCCRPGVLHNLCRVSTLVPGCP